MHFNSSIFLFFFVILLTCLQVSPYSHTPIQYHIQTDKGPNRYFRFQTINGQFRREKRFEDGSVVGTYGWVDPTGLLRLYDYMADKDGYRIVREQTYKVNLVPPSPNTIPDPSTKAYAVPQQPLSSVIKDMKKKTTDSQSSSSQTGTTATTTPVPPTVASRRIATTPEAPIVTTSGNFLFPSTQLPTVLPVKTKSKLRPLFIAKKKRRRKPQVNRFADKKRQNYVSSRRRVQAQTQAQAEAQAQAQTQAQTQVQYTQPPTKHDVIVDASTIRRKPHRTKTYVRPYTPSATSTNKVENPPYRRPQKSIPDFGYNRPGGTETINFDLGVQYRKEKVFPDGTVVGEHGYVDPLGILRVTTYTSGTSKGLQQAKQSYWVGTRDPGQ